jgi:hypothetical protein
MFLWNTDWLSTAWTYFSERYPCETEALIFRQNTLKEKKKLNRNQYKRVSDACNDLSEIKYRNNIHNTKQCSRNRKWNVMNMQKNWNAHGPTTNSLDADWNMWKVDQNHNYKGMHKKQKQRFLKKTCKEWRKPQSCLKSDTIRNIKCWRVNKKKTASQ